MFKIFTKYFLTVFFILLSLSCSYGKNVKIDLAEIAEYNITPQRVFVIKNKLFLDYNLANLYLTVRIPKKADKYEIKRLKLDAENISKKENKIEEIKILPNEIYQQIISELTTQYGLEQELIEYNYKNDLG